MTLTATVQSLQLQQDASALVTLQTANGNTLTVNVPAGDIASYPLGGTKTITVS